MMKNAGPAYAESKAQIRLKWPVKPRELVVLAHLADEIMNVYSLAALSSLANLLGNASKKDTRTSKKTDHRQSPLLLG